MDRRSGKIIENAPKHLKSKEAALVRIIPLSPICVEKFAEYPPLGRFVIRDMEQAVIVGVIVDVEKKATATSKSRRK
jgi:elongation factor 1-alpha